MLYLIKYWKWFATGALILMMVVIVSAHFAKDAKTRAELTKANSDLVAMREELRQTQNSLLEATISKQQIETQVAVADNKRVEIQTQLAQTLKKLKARPVPAAPKQCDDIVNFIYDGI